MNIDNKFLLVCLQLIIVVLMSMNVEGMPDVSSLIDSSQDRPTSRAYRLFNHCARKSIVIQDRISTTDNHTDDKAILILESVMLKDEDKPRIQIRGNSSGMYLCFNNKGKLVSRPKNILQKKGRREKCQFFEVAIRDGWSFKSVKNDRWYVGFSRKGTPMKGSDHVLTDREDCFQYTKRSIIDEGKNAHNSNKGNVFDAEEHNNQVGKPGQAVPGLDITLFLENKNTELPPHHRHRHEYGRLSSRSPNLRHTKKSHRNRKSFSRTKIER